MSPDQLAEIQALCKTWRDAQKNEMHEALLASELIAACENMLAHIRQQAQLIDDLQLSNRNLKINKFLFNQADKYRHKCNTLEYDLKISGEAYNIQKKRIKTLKTALLKERSLTLSWCDDPAYVGSDVSEEFAKNFEDMAKEELKKEYPGVGWD